MKYLRMASVPDHLLYLAKYYDDKVVVMTDESCRLARELASVAETDKAISLAKTRFALCRVCSDSRDSGHECIHHKGCCFGNKRSRPEYKCPKGAW